jgi:hypothetical protein
VNFLPLMLLWKHDGKAQLVRWDFRRLACELDCR